MPFAIEMQFDGGLKNFKIALQDLAGKLHSFKKLFEMIQDYFEGKDIRFNRVIGQSSTKEGVLPRTEAATLNPAMKDPILEIWKSEGQKIGSNWTNSALYEQWKNINWKDAREFNIPIDRKNAQVLTGQTLFGLLNRDDSTAVRVIDDLSMVYGIDNEYAKYWQEKRKILDFFPAMLEDIRHIVTAFVQDAAALEWEGEV